MVNAFDGMRLTEVYAFDWRDDHDAAVAKLNVPRNAVVDEQFAKQHGIAVGERFELRAATGRRATLTADAVYCDPMILQGAIINRADFRHISASTDP